ncbi:MAG: MBL fold metallo-hydrolase, partial [Pseudomonadota bacterium]
VEYADEIHMRFNSVDANNISVEADLQAPAPMVDQSEMTADALGNGVYQVGQEDYSLFALHDDGWMVVNGFAGLPDRLAAANAETGSERQMSHVVLTHHHSEHIDGLDEAIALGATIVISPETEKYLESEREDFDSLDTLIVGDGDRLGPLRFILGSTSHASDILFVYAEPSKTLFQDGHYHALLEQGPSRIQPSAVEMHAIVSASGLDVDWLVSGHAKNAERWETFEQGIAEQDPLNKCPSGRAICSDVPPMTIHTG